MKKVFIVAVLIIAGVVRANAQGDTLKFTVEDLGNNKIRISWTNQLQEDCIQLMVQASNDSLRNYRTIFSTESPQLPQNGFIYNLNFKANYFYRIFYIRSDNNYFFTKARKAGPPVFAENAETKEITKEVVAQKPSAKIDPIRIITIRTKDSVLAQLKYSDYYQFKDSVSRNTKDTLFVLSENEVLLKPYNPENYYRPSPYVMTNRDGFVIIKLPEALQKKYRITFIDADGKKIFSINHITETELIIDKTNFLHAGWFKFELYENDKLKEKNRVLLQRDF